MEFTQGGRRGGYIWDEEDKDEAHKESPFVPPPPPPSCTVAPRPARIEEVSDEPSAAAAAAPIEKEHMFDKVVTPSDVGKLNRLVIPKQHAEKYFPLDAAANEKGLLLSFEDRNGKPWKFRYSYWNSSQSYVMTKGWSRFVKEKRLDAGDTVSFGRGVGEAARDRFFIDWKRRPDCHHPTRLARLPLPHPSATHGPLLSFARSPSTPWAAGRLFVPPPTPTAVFDHRHIAQGYAYNSASTSGGITAGQYVYLRSSLPPHGAVQLDALTNAAGSVPMVLDSVPVGHKTMGKRVRLFGVNLDCPESTRDDNAYPAPPLQLQLGWAESSSKQQQYSLDPAIYRKQK